MGLFEINSHLMRIPGMMNSLGVFGYCPRRKVHVSLGTAALPPEAIHWELPLMELPPLVVEGGRKRLKG